MALHLCNMFYRFSVCKEKSESLSQGFIFHILSHEMLHIYVYNKRAYLTEHIWASRLYATGAIFFLFPGEEWKGGGELHKAFCL